MKTPIVNPDSSGLLRLEDAADYLACSRSQIYRLIRHGELPSVMVGQARRIPIQAVIDFCARHTQQAKG